MQFQHLIEINDPLNPLIDTLTREQLWRGLVLRAEMPKLFVPHLDECRLLERNGNVQSRSLRYGELIIHDHVTYDAPNNVRYDVPAQGEIPASSLVMTIEEPHPAALFVRFEYDNGIVDDDMDAFYNAFRRSAYQESDIDTVRVIRQLAGAGRLQLPM